MHLLWQLQTLPSYTTKKMIRYHYFSITQQLKQLLSSSKLNRVTHATPSERFSRVLLLCNLMRERLLFKMYMYTTALYQSDQLV